MKKTFIILGLALIISSCGNNNKPAGSSDTTTTVDSTTKTVSTTTPMSKDTIGAGLLAKNDCLTCHSINEKKIGPAYADVATKYAPATPAIVDTLANKVIKGGSGNWGQIAMSPHPALSMDDARTMVKYILSLK